MADIPGIVFQAPGGPGKDAAAEKAAERSAAAQPEETRGAANEETTAPQAPADPAGPTDAPQAADATEAEAAEGEQPTASDDAPKRRRAAARRGQQQQAFPVHVVKPHPLAFERAQEILESNSSYTKILPGDEPGTVIIR